MRRARIAATLLAMAALGMPAPAPAFDQGGGCGRSEDAPWRTTDTCTFDLRGFPITVFGNAETTSGAAEVRVWVTSRNLGPTLVLVECSARRSRFAQCSSGLPDQTQKVDLTAVGGLRCHVEGIKAGTYWCQSGGF